MENQANLATTETKTTIKAYDLNGQLPNLNEATEINADFTSEYWTPEVIGEEKRCFFQGIENSTYTDEKTGESIELPCVILVSQDEKGVLKTIRNGSVRLVSTIGDNVEKGIIVKGTPLKIVYNGKKKNKNNAFSSDVWSIKPLIIG